MSKEKDLEYWKNNAEEDYMKVPISVLKYITELEEKVKLFDIGCVMPCSSEIETASLDYRDKSDEENMDDEHMVKINWYDKQEAFAAGVGWLMSKLNKA